MSDEVKTPASVTDTGYVETAGARLYYEVQGAGPVLVLIHGSGGDTDSHADAMTLLTEHYTVVTYDRRDHGHSNRTDPDAPVTLAEHSDDAAALLEYLDVTEAKVFGSSAGATVALDMLTRHPDRVAKVVAHEPPIISILPDATELLREFNAVLDTDRSEGPLPASVQFFVATGILGPRPGPMVQVIAQAVSARPVPPFRELHPIIDYVPDLDTLQERADRLVIAAGQAHPESMPYRASQALADALRLPLSVFPGNHFGYMQMPRINDPAAFTALLRTRLEDSTPA